MTTFNLVNGNEAVTGLGENDIFNFLSNSNTALGGDGNDTFNIQPGNIRQLNQAFGNNGDDLFVTNSLSINNMLSGGDGTDVWRMSNVPNSDGGFNNTFNGGNGTDWVDARLMGFDSVFNFSGSTVLAANGTQQYAGINAFNTLTSVEAVVGRDGGAGDSFIGGAFNMRFDGYGGNDTAVGGSGSETFLGGEGADNLSGNDGNDLLTGGTWDATGVYVGGAGSNVLSGGNGNDAIIAGNGGDLITVGDGALDYVRLGVRRDVLQCDGTSDFVSVAGFTVAGTAVPGNDADVLRLLSSTGIDTFDELLSHATDFTSGGVFGTVIRTDNGGVIYLDGVRKSSLVATDFIFG